jgi:transcription antitermination factor NusG
VPTEEVTEIKNGKRAQVNRKVLPGYLLVRMELNDESWGAVRNTPGVTASSGHLAPSPLTHRRGRQDPRPGDDAAGRARQPVARPTTAAVAAPAAVVDFEVGESVTVMDGPVRHAARHHQRDQRRAAEAAGAGLHLRPRDARRAVVQPGLQDLTRLPHQS